MKRFLCWLGWHRWEVAHDASPWLSDLHPLAGTLHYCQHCSKTRDWRGEPSIWADAGYRQGSVVGPRR